MSEVSSHTLNVDSVWARQKIRLPVLLGTILCLLGIHFFHFEQELQLFRLFSVFVAGFAAIGMLPVDYRLKFVWALNAGAIFALFGIPTGIGIIAMGLLFFLIVNLSVHVWWRVLASILLGGLLAAGKMGFLPYLDFGTVATVVGGLFMFRSILYLYESYHGWQHPSVWLRLNYFFLLPNLIFVIFPVVDLKTFTKTYQPEVPSATLHKGLLWIMRGMFHLFLYRIIYYYLVPDPQTITSVYPAIQYMAMSYALIIRLSGIFHLSTGMLCLLGFNLPPTFDNYFLATGFSDLWRRINVYWKDFMMKVFYFPIYFRFPKRNALAVFITVMLVFLINWLLHQYQWFWIRGNFPIRMIDIIFWMAFGVLVAANSIVQMRKKRKKVNKNEFVIKDALMTTLKIIGMFAFMSVLWSFWTSPGISEWLAFINVFGTVSFNEISTLGECLIGLCIIGVAAHYVGHWLKVRKLGITDNYLLKLYTAGWLAAVVVASPLVMPGLSSAVAFDFGPVLETRLNQADESRLFKGYYESLLVGNNLNSRIWEVKEDREDRADQRLIASNVLVKERLLIEKSLKLNHQTTFKGLPFRTNSLGLRDREYVHAKPAGVFRFVVQGGSSEMGSGVKAEEVFEEITEDKLNEKFGQIEMLNFSISGLRMANQVGITEEKILKVEPDVLLYFLHEGETRRGLSTFYKGIMDESVVSRYPGLKEISDKFKVAEAENRDVGIRRLIAGEMELAQWTAKRMGTYCEANRILAVVVNVPISGRERGGEVTEENLMKIFDENGFLTIDLRHIYDGLSSEEVTVSTYNRHPSALAHRVLADSLYERLIDHPIISKMMKRGQ